MQREGSSAAAYVTYRPLSEMSHATVQEGCTSQLRGYVRDQIVIEHGIVVTTSSRVTVVRMTRGFRPRVPFGTSSSDQFV
jgi:hypothetical protein